MVLTLFTAIPPSNLFKGLDYGSDFYFVHSYRMGLSNDDAGHSFCEYGEKFLSSFEFENIYGTQFHPEKSQSNGIKLLQNFIKSNMLKKRLIFTLLYDSGNFMLSRNFNLQRVGDVNWLSQNYNFSSIAFSIDELIILDVSRDKRDSSGFIEAVKQITKECFVPVSAGGGVKNLSDATMLLKSGADKVVLNSLVFEDVNEVSKISHKFGAQSIVASIDLKKEGKKYHIYTSNGQQKIDNDPKDFLKKLKNFNIGEVFLNSIDKDGTAQGLDLGILDLVDDNFNLPLILGGGAGHHNHLFDAFSEEKVDAVSTAHLFNFVGDGLEKCRVGLISKGMNLAKWDKPEI